MGKQRQDLQQEYELSSRRGSDSRSGVLLRGASQTEGVTDEDSSDEDDMEVRYVDDEVILAVISLLKKLNQQRMDLGLEPDEAFIPSAPSDAEG